MAKRRGRGEGSITQRADGRWMARVSLGFVNGKLRRKSVYGKTKEEALAAMREIQRNLDKGLPVQASSPTVSSYLTEWLERCKAKVSPRTYLAYDNVVRLHVIPAIGNKRLEKLNQRDVNKMLSDLSSRLSPASIDNVRRVLIVALNQAMREDLIGRNVATLSDTISVPRFEAKALTRAEADALLSASQDSRYALVYRLALSAGLRLGELLGLRWEDVDFDNSVIRIRRQLQVVDGVRTLRELKTPKSRRTIPLPASLMQALREQRNNQRIERLQAGGKWVPHWELVFMTPTGTPVSDATLRRDFQRASKEAGLEGLRFHDLRHSAASFMAAQGVHMSATQAILGHSQVTTTAQIYTHVQIESMRDAITDLDTLLNTKKRAN